MAAALKVVSAPDAFMQSDKPFQPPLLPNFSFDKQGALVKTMSRKHSIFKQASDATAAATDLHAGTSVKATRRQSSTSSQQSDAAAATMVKTMSHNHSNSSQQFDGSAAANVPREAALQLGRTSLAAIPEDMSVHGSTPRSQVQHITFLCN